MHRGDLNDPNPSPTLKLPVEEALAGLHAKLRCLERLPRIDERSKIIQERPTTWEVEQADLIGLRSQFELQHLAWQQAGLPMAQKSAPDFPLSMSKLQKRNGTGLGLRDSSMKILAGLTRLILQSFGNEETSGIIAIVK